MFRSTYVVILVGVIAARAWSADAEQLRAFFEGLQAGAQPYVAQRRLHEPGMLMSVYAARGYQPIFTGGGPLARELRPLIEELSAAAAHGLSPGAYHVEALAALAARGNEPVALEVLAADAFLAQVRHRATGVVAPRELDSDWHLLPAEIDPRAALENLAQVRGSVRAALVAAWPDHDEYRALVAERARISALGELESATIPSGPVLKPGQTGPRVALLKDRLLGPGEHDPAFDAELQAAVVAFQQAAGLEADGIVGPATLEVLNARKVAWIDRIDANLERWRWLPRRKPDTYVRVNIAAFTMRVIADGAQAMNMKVIVGRPYRRTPVFTELMRYMVFNPFWNVPFKLATQDKLPQLKTQPALLAEQGYEVRLGGQDAFLPADQVDWQSVTRQNWNHLLRQRPGPHNALGKVKFMLPNPHSVYLHDTPSRELFAKQERSFSSGCIRLAEPLQFAEWLLRNDGNGEAAAAIERMLGQGAPATVNLRKPVPVYIVYFTAFADEDGSILFRRDLYERDAAIVRKLRADGHGLPAESIRQEQS